VAVILNIDSIHLFRVISLDENLRSNLVTMAESVAATYDTIENKSEVENETLIEILNTGILNIDTSKVDTNMRNIVLSTSRKVDSLRVQLKISDSLNQYYFDQANEVIDVSARLGLPIGWSRNIAPWSWVQRRTDSVSGDAVKMADTLILKRTIADGAAVIDTLIIKPATAKSGELAASNKQARKNRLLQYMEERNSLGSIPWKSYAPLWLLGILITSFMLSFGATFWFDLLLKLVNIRRAGIKPSAKNKPTATDKTQSNE
jgi:hypothetical protein